MTVCIYQRKTCAATNRWWYLALGLCKFVVAATTVLGQQTPNRFLITQSQIVAVLQGQGLPVAGVDIKIAAPVTAVTAEPLLDLRSGSILNSHELRLRISCHTRAQCLPFFVTATWPAAIDVSTLPVKMERQLFKRDLVDAGVSPSRNYPETAAQTTLAPKVALAQEQKANLNETSLTTPIAGHSAAEGMSSSGSQVKAVDDYPRPVPSLRNGSAATLEIEEDKIHIRVAVICLQDGAIGDKVRVTSRDRKQFYMAEIIAPALLKGTL